MRVVIGVVVLAATIALSAVHDRQVGEPGKPTYHVDTVALQYLGTTQIPATVIDESFQGTTARLLCEPIGFRRAPPDSSPMSRAQ